MNIVTYNLRFGGKKDNRSHWQQIFDDFVPDIFLVQETYQPDTYQFPGNHERAVWAKAGSNAWGSAIYLRDGQFEPITVSGFEGWLAGLETDAGKLWPWTADRLRIFSLHAPTLKSGSNYIKFVHQILDRIAEFPNDADLIIGGDFNTTIAWRHPSENMKFTRNHRELLTRLRREFGLINCWQALHPNQNLPQTLRWSSNKATPYHCDGIFVPASWYRYLNSCEVPQGDPWLTLSDHNPVVATFAES